MNNRKVTKGRKRQEILSEPSRILIGTYANKHGDVKNKYKANPNSKVVKTINHIVI